MATIITRLNSKYPESNTSQITNMSSFMTLFDFALQEPTLISNTNQHHNTKPGLIGGQPIALQLGTHAEKATVVSMELPREVKPNSRYELKIEPTDEEIELMTNLLARIQTIPNLPVSLRVLKHTPLKKHWKEPHNMNISVKVPNSAQVDRMNDDGEVTETDIGVGGIEPGAKAIICCEFNSFFNFTPDDKPDPIIGITLVAKYIRVGQGNPEEQGASKKLKYTSAKLA